MSKGIVVEQEPYTAPLRVLVVNKPTPPLWVEFTLTFAVSMLVSLVVMVLVL